MRLPVALLMFLIAYAAHADDVDAESARAAVQRGELLPLSRILEMAQQHYPGRILEVELERDDGQLVYELEVLQKDGRVLEVQYDGKTGRQLEVEIEDD